MLNIARFSLIATACMTVSLAPLAASAKVVGEPALMAACAKEAAHRLAMNESDVLTLPTELTKGTYYVNGQVSREDGSLMMVECKFDGKKHFTTITIDGKAYKVSGAPAVDRPRQHQAVRQRRQRRLASSRWAGRARSNRSANSVRASMRSSSRKRIRVVAWLALRATAESSQTGSR